MPSIPLCNIPKGMTLKSISLQHFRNFHSQKIEFHPQFNFIYGKNAQGKTNVMEAIYYLAELKSFRTSDRKDLIQKGEEFAKIEAQYEKDDLNWDMEVVLNQSSRKVSVNHKKPKTRKEYYELIPLILFEPRNIYLFRDSPSQRRKYLNRALYVQDAGFIKLVNDYDKVITQKNKVLKEYGQSEFVDVWNEKLAELGAEIIYLRLKWFEGLKSYLSDEYQAISQLGESFQLKYKSSKNWLEDLGEGVCDLEIGDLKEKLLLQLEEFKSREMERRESLIGPHRDDFEAYLDDREIGAYGSQGENRSAIIALKMAQLKMFSEKYKKTPLFLLDDVASELDEYRCQYLFTYLRDEQAQVFLTTTENSHMGQDFAGKSHSFLVEAGSLSVLA